MQLQRAGVLRLQSHIGEAKTILAKLKDMAAHNAEYHYQEGGIAEAEGTCPVRQVLRTPVRTRPGAHGCPVPPRVLERPERNDLDAIGYYEKCLKHPPVGKGVLYNLGVLYEDNGSSTRPRTGYRRLHKADPLDERARLFFKDAEQSMTMYYSPEDEQISVQFRQVMEVPITDFELSVRSRNCLKRMNIRTLRDLTASRNRNCWRARTSAKRRWTRSKSSCRKRACASGSRSNRGSSTSSATARNRTCRSRTSGPQQAWSAN